MPDFDPNEHFDLSDYNPQWAQVFEQERKALAAAIGAEVVEIEHVGSTSVPGLRAKPIIDLLVAVERFAPLEVYIRRLEPLGYYHQSHEADHDRLFFWKGQPRTHHMHIVEYATWEHQRHLIFRDYLRTHPDIARQYAAIKLELVNAFPANRPAYTRGKTAFIKAIMTRAVEEISNPHLRSLMERAENLRLDEDPSTAPAHNDPDNPTG